MNSTIKGLLINPPRVIIDGRDITIDIMKCVAVSMVIIGHCELGYWFDGWPIKVLYSCHMPLFFIVAGYMYKHKSIKEIISSGVRTLLYPYFVFGLITMLIAIFRDRISVELAVKVLFTANVSWSWIHNTSIGPIWFLVALFWIRLFFSIIITHKENFHLPICIILSAGSLFFTNDIIPQFCIINGLNALVFMSVGYAIKQRGLNVIVMVALLIAWVVSFVSFPMDMYGMQYENYAINVAGGIGGTIALFFLGYTLTKIAPPIAKKVSFFGKYSLHVLCWHQLTFHYFAGDVLTGKWNCLLYFIVPFIITLIDAKTKWSKYLFRFPK